MTKNQAKFKKALTVCHAETGTVGGFGSCMTREMGGRSKRKKARKSRRRRRRSRR